MMKALLKILTILFLFASCEAFSQENRKIFVSFKDKDGVSFDPYSYFDAKAIQRRLDQNLPLYDFADMPVKEEYSDKVASIVHSVKYISRWLNGMVCMANNEQIAQLKKLFFIEDIEELFSEVMLASYNEKMETSGLYDELSEANKNLLSSQVSILGAEQFEEKGINGKGIRIAIFDAGFPGVDTHPAFEHIRKENRIVKTWDFVKRKEFVYSYNSHGTMVMSCIGGLIDGKKMGLATGSEFLLARTEKAMQEPFSEEENWLAAAEWADKNGAHIINSSLGYTFHRYFTHQMDGKTSLVSRAANMAASKGILVVNAAGNDGSNKWKIIGTPADADSVLSVGGIDPELFYKISFSSFGPASTKKIKPNIAAFGKVIAANGKKLTTTQGTSFSSPLVAGFAACAWQMNKSLTNMQLFKEIEKSGTLYPYFDYAHGYGIPRAGFFTNSNLPEPELSFDLVEEDYTIKIMIRDGFLAENPEKSEKPDYLYYHIENELGYLEKYYVIYIYSKEVLTLFKEDLKKGSILRFHFKGYTQELKI
jgi:serine protease AprX